MDPFKEKKEKGLSILRQAKDPVSGEEMSKELGVSRAAVWKYIEALRDDGYEIVGISNQGYRLMASPNLLLPPEIKLHLPDDYPGEIFWFDQLGSTNDEAKAIAGRGAPGGSIVVAEQQSVGRGRRGRSWISPKGGLWFSILLRPEIGLIIASRISVFAAVVVAEEINRLAGLKTAIKWPNDIFIGDKKVSGILIELSAELDRVAYVVVGVGINANIKGDQLAKDLDQAATTILDETGKQSDRKVLLANIASRLSGELDDIFNGAYGAYLDKWKNLSMVLGKVVKIEEAGSIFTGKAIDIEENGSLVVELEEGKLKAFESGEVSLRLK